MQLKKEPETLEDAIHQLSEATDKLKQSIIDEIKRRKNMTKNMTKTNSIQLYQTKAMGVFTKTLLKLQKVAGLASNRIEELAEQEVKLAEEKADAIALLYSNQTMIDNIQIILGGVK